MHTDLSVLGLYLDGKQAYLVKKVLDTPAQFFYDIRKNYENPSLNRQRRQETHIAQIRKKYGNQLQAKPLNDMQVWDFYSV